MDYKYDVLLEVIIITYFIKSMGNNWGIIHNQSKEEIVYMLHHSELTATEASITKKFGAEIAANMTTGASGGVNGQYA